MGVTVTYVLGTLLNAVSDCRTLKLSPIRLGLGVGAAVTVTHVLGTFLNAVSDCGTLKLSPKVTVTVT